MKLFTVLITRGGGAFLALVSTILALKNLGAHDAGSFFTAIAYSMFFVVFLTFGGNQSLLKNIRPGKEVTATIVSHLKVTLSLYLLLSPIAVLSIFFFFNIGVYQTCLITLCSLTYSISQQLHHCYISLNKQSESYVASTWLPNIIIICSTFSKDVDVVLVSYAVGYFISSLLHIRGIWGLINTESSISNSKEVWSIRSDYFQQDILGQTYTSLIVVIASMYIEQSDVAILAMYMKVASLCNLFVGILNVSSYPKIIENYRESNVVRSSVIMRNMSALGVGFVTIYSLCIYLSWSKVVAVLEVGDMSVEMMLLLLSAYLFVAYSSVRQMLLNSMGYSKLVRNYSWVVFLLGMTCLLYMSKNYALEGSVIALGFILTLQSVFSIVSFRRLSVGKAIIG